MIMNATKNSLKIRVKYAKMLTPWPEILVQVVSSLEAWSGALLPTGDVPNFGRNHPTICGTKDFESRFFQRSAKKCELQCFGGLKLRYVYLKVVGHYLDQAALNNRRTERCIVSSIG